MEIRMLESSSGKYSVGVSSGRKSFMSEQSSFSGSFIASRSSSAEISGTGLTVEGAATGSTGTG